MRILKWLRDALVGGLVFDIIKWTLVLALPAVTGYFGLAQQMPIAWVMFSVLGVFAFSVTGYHYAIASYGIRRVRRQVRITQLELMDVEYDVLQKKLRHLVLWFGVQNRGGRDLRIRLSRCDLSLQGLVNPVDRIVPPVQVISAGETVRFGCPSIANLDMNRPIEGRLEVQIDYGGSKRSHLSYRMTVIQTVLFVVRLSPTGEQAFNTILTATLSRSDQILWAGET